MLKKAPKIDKSLPPLQPKKKMKKYEEKKQEVAVKKDPEFKQEG